MTPKPTPKPTPTPSLTPPKTTVGEDVSVNVSEVMGVSDDYFYDETDASIAGILLTAIGSGEATKSAEMLPSQDQEAENLDHTTPPLSPWMIIVGSMLVLGGSIPLAIKIIHQ